MRVVASILLLVASAASAGSVSCSGAMVSRVEFSGALNQPGNHLLPGLTYCIRLRRVDGVWQKEFVTLPQFVPPYGP